MYLFFTFVLQDVPTDLVPGLLGQGIGIDGLEGGLEPGLHIVVRNGPLLGTKAKSFGLHSSQEESHVLHIIPERSLSSSSTGGLKRMESRA